MPRLRRLRTICGRFWALLGTSGGASSVEGPPKPSERSGGGSVLRLWWQGVSVLTDAVPWKSPLSASRFGFLG